jgi:hypothetical protein
MHLRYCKSRGTQFAVAEFDEFGFYILVVEEIKIAGDFVFLTYARVFINSVIIAHLVVVQYFINCFTAVAAENFVADMNRFVGAIFSAMKADQFQIGVILDCTGQ